MKLLKNQGFYGKSLKSFRESNVEIIHKSPASSHTDLKPPPESLESSSAFVNDSHPAWDGTLCACIQIQHIQQDLA